MSSTTGQTAPSHTSPAVTNPAPPAATTMEPKMDAGLLALACSGSFHDLESLLNWIPTPYIGSLARQPPSLYAVTVGGDTLLHVVAASYGDSEDLLKKASLVYSKAHSLLFVQNSSGDTPLHHAARAENVGMVSLLVDLANGQGVNNAKGLLETQNKLKETALHDAIRIGSNDMVNLLMTHRPELATLPEEGTSPLYLAILMENKIIAETLYELSGGVLSYSGPNGQNALHAAVQRSQDLTKMLLEWNNDLTLRVDANGSTPLHFAVVGTLRQIKRDSQSICSQVLKANPDALYLLDHNGSFPTHVASSTGATWVIDDFLMKSPSCAGLLDARGRTFLHVAVDGMNTGIVDYACRNISLSWILNVQDKDGNTALHLAVRKRSLRLFCSLFSNRQVNLNLPNEKGETPLDIACNNILGGLYSRQNDDAMMQTTLKYVGAKMGVSGFIQKNNVEKSGQDEIHRINQVKEGTQSLCIGSVLIATVTFGATFAVPGGYRADEHTNAGTPTLATTNAFSAFILATAMAFTFSAMATISLMSSGCPMIHLQTREVNLTKAYFFMMNSVSFLAASFSIGTFMILSPVAPLTALLVYGMSCVLLAYYSVELASRKNLLFMTVCKRNGICYGIGWALPVAATQFAILFIFQLCPMIFILIDTDNAGHKVEPPAQAPTPFA